MPTTKQRINITLDKQTEWALKQLAKINKVPVATKAAEMLRDALELQEDLILAEIANERSNQKNVKYIDHDTFWKKVENNL